MLALGTADLRELCDHVLEGRQGWPDAVAKNGVDDAESVDNCSCPRVDALEVLIGADCGDLLVRPANEDEAREITTVRAEEDGLEPLDRSTRLLRGPEVRRVPEDCEPLGLPSPHNLAPTDEESSLCHDDPLSHWPGAGYGSAGDASTGERSHVNSTLAERVASPKPGRQAP
jgi:hypothetical protein